MVAAEEIITQTSQINEPVEIDPHPELTVVLKQSGIGSANVTDSTNPPV
jgi:hypothetical protein